MAATENVSQNCATGKHSRCLGTVLVFPPKRGGQRIVPCECDAPDCPHAVARRAAAATTS